MAEIKSAIELAMEKTRNLVMDSQEREAMGVKDLEGKIKAVLRRHEQEMISSEEAARELNAIKADKGFKRTLVVNNLVDEFNLHGDNERLLVLFQLVGLDLPEAIHRELEELTRTFRKDLARRKAATGEKIRNILAEQGILGNGMEPNTDAWEEWREEIEQAQYDFGKRLEELKDKIRATKGNQ
mgnify:CR=1 FL=1